MFTLDNFLKKLKGLNFLRFFRNSNHSSSIILTTGGTGGHIVPAMKIASDLINEGRVVYFITDRRFHNYEKLFAFREFFFSQELKVVVTPITSLSGSKIRFLLNFFSSFFTVIAVFMKARPKIVIGFGSYVSFLPLLVGVLSFRKIILHEQNVILGRVNRFFSRFANSILLTFPDTSFIPKSLEKKIKIAGFPSFATYDLRRKGNLNKAIHDLMTKEEITILITGGGQGASFFSVAIPPAIIAIAKAYPNKMFRVFHQVKQGEIENTLMLYNRVQNIILEMKPLFENIPEILKKTDFAIIRGGAGSIVEVASSKVFPIVIPIPNSVGNHQVKNASVLAINNAGIMFSQNEYTPEKLAMVISRAINDGIFYFPIVNTAFEIFKSDVSQIFESTILHNDLKS